MIGTRGGARDFKELAVKMRKAGTQGKGIRKATTKAIQTGLKPIVLDVKESVKSVKTKGVKGHGHIRRAQLDASKDARRVAIAESKGKKSRRRRAGSIGFGLRARIANGVKSRVQWSGHKIGARIWTETTGLPNSQRTLPRHLDSKGGWRHPVYGHTDRWVGQTGQPWFDPPIKRRQAALLRVVKTAVDKGMKELQ